MRFENVGISRLILLVLAVGVGFCGPRAAWADQPAMVRADPSPGSEVSVPPTEIRIWFTDEIDPLCRCVSVWDSNGNQVDGGDTHTAADNQKELIVSIPDRIYDGQYTVKWEVHTPDERKNSGSFTFTVNIKD